MISDDIVITGSRAMARSYAKLNLTLDVTGARPDGYHEVEMIMQTTTLFDLLIIDKTKGGIRVSTNLKYLPTGDRNIAYKAAAEFFRRTRIRGGARIMIHKNIPVAAGLAGGSGNAAAVLCALNMLYSSPLTSAELCEIGASLGADVPYCILGGTYLATGIGDTLTRLSAPPDAYVLMVKPPVNVSTRDVYAEIDNAAPPRRPDTQGVIRALDNGDLTAIGAGLCNVMESVTMKKHPQLCGIKQKLILNGALGAVMSGSGPTMFGIFDDYRAAKRSADSFGYRYRDVFLTKFYR